MENTTVKEAVVIRLDRLADKCGMELDDFREFLIDLALHRVVNGEAQDLWEKELYRGRPVERHYVTVCQELIENRDWRAVE